MTDIPHCPLIIIGAGLSGIGTAIQLKRLQSFTSYEIYEKADSLGGTWYPPPAEP
jgi:cation diffusion facilitator CzcD-associated flavoprotein CzcO